jgi:hypothetical protein
MFIQPIILNDSITIPANAKRSPTGIGLQNPFQEWIQIDSIRIVTAQVATNSPDQINSSVRVRFMLGNVPITDYVHLSCLHGTQDNKWVLDTPIYVPPRGFLVPDLWNSNEWNAGTATVEVTYYARIVRNPPRRFKVPWICGFVTAPLDGGSDVIVNSKATDLRNPFDDTISVKRFVGRVSSSGLSANNSALLRFSYLNVSMFDHQRRIVVPGRVPFGTLFNVNDSTWTAPANLPSRGYYIATLNAALSHFSSSQNPRIFVMISMVGEHEVTL